MRSVLLPRAAPAPHGCRREAPSAGHWAPPAHHAGRWRRGRRRGSHHHVYQNFGHRQWTGWCREVEALRQQLHLRAPRRAVPDPCARTAVPQHATLCRVQLERLAEELRFEELRPVAAAVGWLRPLRWQCCGPRAVASAAATPADTWPTSTGPSAWPVASAGAAPAGACPVPTPSHASGLTPGTGANDRRLAFPLRGGGGAEICAAAAPPPNPGYWQRFWHSAARRRRGAGAVALPGRLHRVGLAAAGVHRQLNRRGLTASCCAGA